MAEIVEHGVAAAPRARGLGMHALLRLRRQPTVIVASLVLLTVFVFGALAPRLAPQGWNDIHLDPRWQNHRPMLSGWHLLGTDNIGRDVLVRTLYGLHTSEQDAIYAALVGTLIGLIVGAIAGYRGGWVDASLMRFADMLGMFPTMMVLLVAYALLQPVTVAKATAILSAVLWVPAARAIRAHFASLRAAEFVDAARSLGASESRIVLRHLLPNAVGTLIIAATTLLGQVIMFEATVEFFGLGVSSQTQPTLGNLIGDAAQGMSQLGLGWWTWGGPSIVLALILVCATLIGDGLEAALTPNARL